MVEHDERTCGIETNETPLLTYSSTEDTSNFCKLSLLLLDIGTVVLREVFDSHVPPENLIEFLAEQKLRLKHKLSSHQSKILYPEDGRTLTSTSFDISLLYLFLREGCDLKPPQNGWGRKPDPLDFTEAANVERLRQARNDLYEHAQSALIKQEPFAAAWDELSRSLIALGGEKYRSKIDALLATYSDPMQYPMAQERVLEWYFMEKQLEHSVDKILEVIENLSGEDARKAQLMKILEVRGREDQLFVETRAYRHIEHEVLRHGAVLIIGDPGEGKTTSAWHIILKCVLQGYELFVVETADEWREKYHPTKKQIFFVDDCFGKSRGVPDKVEEWQRRYDVLRGGINQELTIFVATSRRLIFRELEETAKRLDIFGKRIDISSAGYALSFFERLQIFHSHMTFANENYYLIGENLMDTIRSGKTPRFPLSCRLYAVEQKFQANGTEFFCNPISQLRDELWNLSRNDPVGFASLTLLLVSDGRLQYDQFDEDVYNPKSPNNVSEWIKYMVCFFSRKKPWFVDILLAMEESKKLSPGTSIWDIQCAIKRLTGIYVLAHENHYSFLHESILETVGIILGQNNLNFVLKYCSAHFIQQHVRVHTKVDHDNDTMCIPVPEQEFRPLAKRLTDDVIRGFVDEVFQNPSVKNECFAIFWCHYLLTIDRIDFFRFCCGVDKKGYSVFYWAARGGHKDTLRFLLQYKSPKDDAIHGACYSGQLDVMQLLIEHQVNLNAEDACGFTPLMIACHSSNNTVVEMLIDHGADVNFELENIGSVLHFACWNEDVLLVKTLLKNGAKANVTTSAGWPSLYFSGSGENYAVLQQLLHKGKNVNLKTNTNWTPLHLAAGKDNSEILSLLLESGADLNRTTTQGWTPLYCACRKKRHSAVKILMDRGADPNIADSFGVSCLHRVCLDGSYLVAKVILDKSVSINVISKAGYTPLHCACERGQADIVHLLLKSGGDTNISGLDGRRPIDVARKKGWDNIVSCLLSYDYAYYTRENMA